MTRWLNGVEMTGRNGHRKTTGQPNGEMKGGKSIRRGDFSEGGRQFEDQDKISVQGSNQ